MNSEEYDDGDQPECPILFQDKNMKPKSFSIECKPRRDWSFFGNLVGGLDSNPSIGRKAGCLCGVEGRRLAGPIAEGPFQSPDLAVRPPLPDWVAFSFVYNSKTTVDVKKVNVNSFVILQYFFLK